MQVNLEFRNRFHSIGPVQYSVDLRFYQWHLHVYQHAIVDMAFIESMTKYINHAQQQSPGNRLFCVVFDLVQYCSLRCVKQTCAWLLPIEMFNFCVLRSIVRRL